MLMHTTMAPLFLLHLLLLLLSLCSASSHGALAATITTYQQFESWPSEDGNFTFGLKTINNGETLRCTWLTADTPNRTPLWWPQNTSPSLTNLVEIVPVNGSVRTNAFVVQSDSENITSIPSYGRLLNTGNLQLLNPTNNTVLWQSFSELRDTLIVRPRDQYSVSSVKTNRNHTILLQSRPPDAASYFSSGRFSVTTLDYQHLSLVAHDSTHDVDFIYAYALMTMTEDSFELTGDSGKTYVDNSSMPTTVLRLDSDGNLRVYAWNASHSMWNMIWQLIDNKCLLASPCGAFGICEEVIDGSLNCTCPSSYQPIDNHNVSLGCYYAFNSSIACDIPGGHTNAGLIVLVDFNRGDYNYNDLTSKSVTDEEGCKQLCLEECHCIVASYRKHDRMCFLKGANKTLMNGYVKEGNTLFMKVLQPRRPIWMDIKWVKKRIVIGVAAIVFMLVIIATVTLWWKRNRGYASVQMMFAGLRGSNKCEVSMGDGGPIKFSYQQLVEATHNFSELLGEGGFGKVYKGTIVVVVEKGKKAGTKQLLPIAVKVLKRTINVRDGEAEKQFRAEVSTLGKIHHVNLVGLLGYYIGVRAPEKRILVYEYIQNGSLSEYLSRQEKPLLAWGVRYSIAVGTARGIAYLHHDCKPQIMHCDIKPQNVLLDHDFTAKVADFGLARRLEEVKNHLTISIVRGTRGYMGPEWLKTVEITSKADVYSYGMVLLELVRGFREGGNDPESLVDWAYQFISSAKGGEHKEPSISNREEESSDEVNHSREKTRLLKIGLWCVQYQPDLRPTMFQILQFIDGNGDDIGVPPYPGPRVGAESEPSSSSSTSKHSHISGLDSILSAR